MVSSLADVMVMGGAITPLLIGMFRTELANAIADYMTYKRRAVKEGDIVELINPHSGEWVKVEVLGYSFGFFATDRVVKFKYCDCSRVEDVLFKDWYGLRKAVVDNKIAEHDCYIGDNQLQ